MTRPRGELLKYALERKEERREQECSLQGGALKMQFCLSE